MTQISIGQKAPAFKLPTADNKTVDLNQFRDQKNVILLFYPLAWTPV